MFPLIIAAIVLAIAASSRKSTTVASSTSAGSSGGGKVGRTGFVGLGGIGLPTVPPVPPEIVAAQCVDPGVPPDQAAEAMALIYATPQTVGLSPAEFASRVEMASQAAFAQGFVRLGACLEAKAAAVKIGNPGVPILDPMKPGGAKSFNLRRFS